MKCYYMDVRVFEDPERFAAGYRLVSSRRREKIDRSKIPSDKRLLLGAGILETKLPVPMTGEGEPQITYNEHEKPFLPEESHLYYNLSHSGHYTVMAVSSQLCGVDVEKVHVSFRSIAKHFYTETENRAVEDAQSPEDMFLRIWTRKESYLKMTGEGLSRELRSFDVWPDAPEGCRFFEHVLEDYRICVCCPEGESEEPMEQVLFC